MRSSFRVAFLLCAFACGNGLLGQHNSQIGKERAVAVHLQDGDEFQLLSPGWWISEESYFWRAGPSKKEPAAPRARVPACLSQMTRTLLFFPATSTVFPDRTQTRAPVATTCLPPEAAAIS